MAVEDIMIRCHGWVDVDFTVEGIGAMHGGNAIPGMNMKP